jgi:hypothetical protein
MSMTTGWNGRGVSADEAVSCIERGMNVFVHAPPRRDRA